MKTRLFEDKGIFISIIFSRNLDAKPSWRYIIDTHDEMLFESHRFSNYELCELESLKKAVEYI